MRHARHDSEDVSIHIRDVTGFHIAYPLFGHRGLIPDFNAVHTSGSANLARCSEPCA